jgi:arylsulfatase A-like enzyme
MLFKSRTHGTATAQEQPTIAFRRKRAFSYLLLAVWFGLLTGFGEVSLLSIKKFLLHQHIRFGPHIAWMTPLADLLLFSVIGLIIFGIAWRWPRRVSLRGATLVFAFFGFLSLLLMYVPMHMLARVLLALGLGVQAARLTAAHAVGFDRLVRRTAGWMLALVLALAVGIHGLQWNSEQRALSKLPPASPGAPNVLLIVMDTVRARSLSLHGYDRATTPNLERLAGKGVVFDMALASAPWTLTSHSSMFTGRLPHELSAGWTTPLDATYPTLAEVLSAHGYRTAGFVANTYYCGYEFGLDRGFLHYEDYVVSPEEFVVSSSLGREIAFNARVRQRLGFYDVLTQKDAAKVNGDFLSWLSSRNDRPFFAFLNYFDAHEPYQSPEPFDSGFGMKAMRKNYLINHETRRGLRKDWQQMSPQEVQSELDAYDNAIAYIDHNLGQLFDELGKRGVLDNTLVIITSDHGEQFGEQSGERRLFVHGNSLYLSLLHVPLLVVYPSQAPSGVRVAKPVSLRDLPATVLDLIGIEERFPGNSLARYWDESAATGGSNEVISEINRASWGEEWYPAVKGDMKSLVKDRYHYIRNGDGSEELYDFEKDPLERDDLAGYEQGDRILGQLRSRLEILFANNKPAE